MATLRNKFLDHGFSDESDHDEGYDSEAAEISKGGRGLLNRPLSKRRKLSHSSNEHEEEQEQTFLTARTSISNTSDNDINAAKGSHKLEKQSTKSGPQDQTTISNQDEPDYVIKSAATAVKKSKKQPRAEKKTKPGVIYLSSLPPYLKPSALRNLLEQRGFEPITRLFLAPVSKAKSSSKRNSRQLYGEGWIEFASKRTARNCAESLNANIVGGKKSGFYHDDLWNMKYLKGMGWDELMAGVREERREEEGRQDDERRLIAKETQRFLEGVEEGKKLDGMKRKRNSKGKSAQDGGAEAEIRRTWRQFQVRGTNDPSAKRKATDDADVQTVLAKIF